MIACSDYPWAYWPELERAALSVTRRRDAARDAALRVCEELLERQARGDPPLELDHAVRRAHWRARDIMRRIRATVVPTVELTPEIADVVPDEDALTPEAAAEVALLEARDPVGAAALARQALGERSARHRARRARRKLKGGGES